MSKITAAFAGITAGLVALFTAVAPGAGAAVRTDDCNRAAKPDRALCHQVSKQHPYGAAIGQGGWSAPSGKVLVHEITHQGYSKAEIHDALKGEAAAYRQWVTAVPVNMDKLPASDCVWIIGFKDEDGKPGGRKLTSRTIDCP